MSRRAAALAAIAAAIIAIPLATALPAGAATANLACGTKKATVSYHWQKPKYPATSGELTWFTVKNRCSQWLMIGFGGQYGSGASLSYLSVAPRAHIQWGSKQEQLIEHFSLGTPPDWKGFVSKATALQCPEPTGTAGKDVAYSSTNVKTIC